MTQTRKALAWALLAALTAVLSYISFRGYLNPELLMYFSNSLTC